MSDWIRLGRANTVLTLAGVKAPWEIRLDSAYACNHGTRQIGIAIQLFQAIGIEHDDTER